MLVSLVWRKADWGETRTLWEKRLKRKHLAITQSVLKVLRVCQSECHFEIFWSRQAIADGAQRGSIALPQLSLSRQCHFIGSRWFASQVWSMFISFSMIWVNSDGSSAHFPGRNYIGSKAFFRGGGVGGVYFEAPRVRNFIRPPPPFYTPPTPRRVFSGVGGGGGV